MINKEMEAILKLFDMGINDHGLFIDSLSGGVLWTRQGVARLGWEPLSEVKNNFWCEAKSKATALQWLAEEWECQTKKP